MHVHFIVNVHLFLYNLSTNRNGKSARLDGGILLLRKGIYYGI